MFGWQAQRAADRRRAEMAAKERRDAAREARLAEWNVERDAYLDAWAEEFNQQ